LLLFLLLLALVVLGDGCDLGLALA